MSDRLISLKAAIEATWEAPSYTDPLNVLSEVRDRIKSLPSAQPESDWGYSEETKQITLIVPEDVYDSAETIFLSVGYEGTFGIRGMVYSVQPEQRSFSCGQENDTISRQAAIDGLEQCEQIYINNLPILVYKKDVYRMIGELND